MWREAVEQIANMLVMEPYPGYTGNYFTMPCRNVVPKPVQKPHPPLWVACSNRDTIRLAARLGLGVLTFAFIDPAEAKQWIDDYYTILKSECTPIGHAINPNIAMVTSFSCQENRAEARARVWMAFLFLVCSGHHYALQRKPGYQQHLGALSGRA
jgi:alkanesulfonate monooxygenase SsuD/methylene tetrahydromethanopterin reductase-like flavin-dependent oxidoreductase (luciferase family)